jgi:ABC-type amino acid transport substrate-binding protein
MTSRLESSLIALETMAQLRKKRVMDDFQNGRLDAVLTNSTTGYSLTPLEL